MLHCRMRTCVSYDRTGSARLDGEMMGVVLRRLGELGTTICSIVTLILVLSLAGCGSGEDTDQAASEASRFGEFLEQHELWEIEEAYTRTFDVNPACALEVVLWDERLSSVSAMQALRETGVRRDKRKQWEAMIAVNSPAPTSPAAIEGSFSRAAVRNSCSRLYRSPCSRASRAAFSRFACTWRGISRPGSAFPRSP